MIRYQLGDTDLVEIRFALSPLCEMGLSLRAIRQPSYFPLQLPWLRRSQEAREAIDMAVLMDLITDNAHTPDFLNPVPSSPTTRLDDELAALARMPMSAFRGQIIELHGHLPERYAGRGRAPLQAVVETLRAYWQGCIAPYWSRMRTVLDADIVYRGRVIAQQGLRAMLDDLSPTIRLVGNELQIANRSGLNRTEEVAGQGLTLIPTMFTRRASFPTQDGFAPCVFYVARGQGAMWQGEQATGSASAAADLLGRTRAHLLESLAEPASATQLAVRLDVSPSAVTQHLRVMAHGGLLTTARHGRSVLYLRSDLGSALLGQ